MASINGMKPPKPPPLHVVQPLNEDLSLRSRPNIVNVRPPPSLIHLKPKIYDDPSSIISQQQNTFVSLKVTVKFDEATSVVVPIESNRMLVSDLIKEAVHRYKKVSNKIVAIFDDQEPSTTHSYGFPHNNNNIDTFSVGTSNSPDFVRSSSTNSSAGSNGTGGLGFNGHHGSGRTYISRKFNGAGTPPAVPPKYVYNKDRKFISNYSSNSPSATVLDRTHPRSQLTDEYQHFKRNNNLHIIDNGGTQDTNNSVVVKHLDDIPPSTSLLVVRRGSEPVLNGPDNHATEDENGNARRTDFGNKKLSPNGGGAAAKALRNKVKWPTNPDLVSGEGRSSTDTEDDNSRRLYGNESTSGLGKFVRSDARKSQFTEEMLEVVAQLAEDRHRHAVMDDENEYDDVGEIDVSFSAGQEKPRRLEIRNFVLKTIEDSKKPLGLHVSPEYGDNRQLSSLIVQFVEPDGRLIDDRQLLKPNDRIVEINDNLVSEMSFSGAQTFLNNASNRGEISLKIMRRPCDVINAVSTESKKRSTLADNNEQPLPTTTTATNATSNFSNSVSSNASAPLSNLQKANTRKIGKIVTVDLAKGADGGLGFTLTSRDNAALGDNFTCIKTILPRGSAVKDGRLKEGDRFLEINGVDVTGVDKDKIVAMLRNIKEGQNAKIVVSRQENVDVASPVLPRPLPPDKANVESLGSERYKQRLVFDIPLNDTGSAGLGVSVKGRTGKDLCSAENIQQDCGIFIKAVMHGGAAHKDGRLKVNDQLIAVNEIDLTNLSNKDAMNRLRMAMQELDPSASSIKLVVLRTIPSSDHSAELFAGGDASMLRPSPTPPSVSPGTPDGGASLLLEMPSPKSNRRTMHYFVPGYGDYAVIVKENMPHAPTLAQGSRTEEHVVIEDDESIACRRPSDVPDNKSETSAVEETDYYQSSMDPFVRDAPARQSMSEKRHGGAKMDPSHTLTYQRIKHQRQSSAPSLQEPPKDSSTPINYKADPSSFNGPFGIVLPSPLTPERRSLSLESLGPSTLVAVQQQQQQISGNSDDRPLLHEQIAQNVLRNSNLHGPPSKVKSKSKISSAQRARMTTNESFRAAVDKSYGENGLEVAVDVGGDNYDSSLDPNGEVGQAGGSSSPHGNSVNKDKSRRKSTGSGLSTLKSLFRFGSGGKANKQLGLAYEQKIAQQQQRHDAEMQDKVRRQAEEENRKIRMHYERFKEQQQQQQNQHSPRRQRGVSPGKQQQQRMMYPPPPSSQPQFYNVTHTKMPSYWKPPVPPAPSNYTPPPPAHHVSRSMHYRYHSPSDPTEFASANNGYHHSKVINGQNYSSKHYDTDDGYGELNVAIVETNRCYRSLERPSAQSVAITGAQRSTGALSYDIQSPNGTIGTNNRNVQHQRNLRIVAPTRRPQQQQQQHSFVLTADDDWPNFDQRSSHQILVENNNVYHYNNVNNVNSNNNSPKSASVAKKSSRAVEQFEQMPPIPPPDYDQYLRTTNKPKASRKCRPASEYVDVSHRTTSLPRRQHQLQQHATSVIPADQQQQPVYVYHNDPAFLHKQQTSLQNGGAAVIYDGYGSLPRNGGHFTTVRM